MGMLISQIWTGGLCCSLVRSVNIFLCDKFQQRKALKKFLEVVALPSLLELILSIDDVVKPLLNL